MVHLWHPHSPQTALLSPHPAIAELDVTAAGSELVKRAVEEMKRSSADEVVLEAETTNLGALALYQNLGFIHDKRLHRCSMNHLQPQS